MKRDAILAAAVAVAYFLAALLGLQLALVGDQVTPLWPPTGLAVVALMKWGYRMIPGVALGALAANLATGPAEIAGLIMLGNVAAPVAAVYLLRKVWFRIELDRVHDVVALVFGAALGCMLLSATAGAAIVTTSAGVSFWSTWATWWTGDAMGVLIFAPMLWLFERAAWPLMSIKTLKRTGEMLVILCGAITVTALATWGTYAATFLVAPFLIWAVLRFGLTGAAPTAMVSAMTAFWGAGMGLGLYGDHPLSLFQEMIILQTFVGSLAFTGLLLSALLEERNKALLQIVRGNRAIEDLVGHLTYGRIDHEGNSTDTYREKREQAEQVC